MRNLNSPCLALVKKTFLKSSSLTHKYRNLTVPISTNFKNTYINQIFWDLKKTNNKNYILLLKVFPCIHTRLHTAINYHTS